MNRIELVLGTVIIMLVMSLGIVFEKFEASVLNISVCSQLYHETTPFEKCLKRNITENIHYIRPVRDRI